MALEVIMPDEQVTESNLKIVISHQNDFILHVSFLKNAKNKLFARTRFCKLPKILVIGHFTILNSSLDIDSICEQQRCYYTILCHSLAV